jgi:hypothetical protein
MPGVSFLPIPGFFSPHHQALLLKNLMQRNESAASG